MNQPEVRRRGVAEPGRCQRNLAVGGGHSVAAHDTDTLEIVRAHVCRPFAQRESAFNYLPDKRASARRTRPARKLAGDKMISNYLLKVV